MNQISIGYYEQAKDSNGIIRSRTTQQIRSWDIPRRERALETFNQEIGKLESPGVYILFAKKTKVYVGESKSLYDRLKTHLVSPEDKIKEWSKAVVINDGRPATQSDFNDTVVRKSLEAHLIKLLRANKYDVVAQGEAQELNPHQKYLVDSLTKELDFLLVKKGIISRVLEEHGQEQVFRDELRRAILTSGRKITKWGAYEVEIDGSKAFVRPGSKKPRGWQITFRGRKPGSFIDSLKKGDGLLLVPRNGVLLIPLTQVQEVIKDKTAYDQDTIDIWITFEAEKVTLRYKEEVIDVTDSRLIKSS